MEYVFLISFRLVVQEDENTVNMEFDFYIMYIYHVFCNILLCILGLRKILFLLL